MNQTKFYILTILVSCVFIKCSRNPNSGTIEHIREITSGIDDIKLMGVETIADDWMTYGGNYQEDRYSSLNQINKSTIDSLGLVWSINLGTTRGLEATPLVVDGIMYLSGAWSMVYAIDVRKGEVIWTFDPEVPREYGEKGCCGPVNRGVALYKGKVYLGAFDGRLIAIDAITGKKEWEVLTVDQSKGYTITGAPRIVKGKVIIGNGGAEYGVRGYVTAYDAISGEQVWRFYTVPDNPQNGFESKAMEDAAKTWTGEWWKYGGGGTAWDAIVYDPELNQLYVGTGNGSPWNREIRSPGGGDNLYLSSIVSLNPDNGEMNWYYQITPGDSWDYTATQPIILADLEIENESRKVLMQAPKNGFFYVIDRTNGDFISAEPFVYTNWAKKIDYETGRPIETSFARYTGVNANIAPHPVGAHNWHPMAFNKSTGLVYIPVREGSHLFGQDKDFEFEDDGRSWNTGTGYDADSPVHQDSLIPQIMGKLIAWDPVKQQEAWSVTHQSSHNAGVLTTEDLVFQGTGKGDFIIYDAKTGKKLWIFPLQTGIVAPPVTYMVDDVQYVTLVAGWGGSMAIYEKFVDQINPGGVYTFAIGGKKAPPTFPVKDPKEIINIEYTATQEQIEHGQKLSFRYCESCHGGGAVPNLIYSKPEIFEAFPQIVGDGIFLGKGMPKFKDRLSEQDINDIKNYILSEAKKRRDKLLDQE
jgi:quinohemoprotein ethanol dehydrogenase